MPLLDQVALLAQTVAKSHQVTLGRSHRWLLGVGFGRWNVVKAKREGANSSQGAAQAFPPSLFAVRSRCPRLDRWNHDRLAARRTLHLLAGQARLDLGLLTTIGVREGNGRRRRERLGLYAPSESDGRPVPSAAALT